MTRTGTPRVYAALQGETVFGAGILGGNGNGGSATYTAVAQYVANLKGENDLTVGLLNLASYGGGFAGLTFTVKDGSTVVAKDTFSTLSSAETFFTDAPLAPKGLTELTGTVDLTLSYTLTTSGGGGAGITYVLGDKRVSAASGALWTFDSASSAVGTGARPRLRIPQRLAAMARAKGPHR